MEIYCVWRTIIKLPRLSEEAQLKKDLLKSIGDQAFFRIKESQVQYLEEQNKHRLGGIHVTTWNKKCSRNIWYSAEQKHDIYTINAETASHFYYGHLIHTTTDLKGKLHELTMAYDFVNDKIIPVWDIRSGKFVLDDTNKWDICIGTNDDMIDIEAVGDSFAIVDKKTYNTEKYTPREPSEDYVLQINIYRLLINKVMALDAKYGVVAYIDTATKGLKHIEFPFELQDIDKTRAHLLIMRKEILDAKANGVLPPRTYSWLCDGYCNHFYRCMLNK